MKQIGLRVNEDQDDEVIAEMPGHLDAERFRYSLKTVRQCNASRTIPLRAKSGNADTASICWLVGGREHTGHWGNVWI